MSINKFVKVDNVPYDVDVKMPKNMLKIRKVSFSLDNII